MLSRDEVTTERSGESQRIGSLWTVRAGGIAARRRVSCREGEDRVVHLLVPLTLCAPPPSPLRGLTHSLVSHQRDPA